MDEAKLMKIKDTALAYSRKMPYRQCSPYGQLALDDAAVQSAFRECYEALQELGEENGNG